jgi:tetratricopeptide (TPR) repeat protein
MTFSEIAPHLANPLVLVGFALLLFFGVHRLLIRSGIIQPIDPKTSGQVVLLLLNYGFYVSVLVIVLGFAYAAYSIRAQQMKVVGYQEVIDGLRAEYQARLDEKERTNALIQNQLKQTIDTIQTLAAQASSDKILDEAVEEYLEKNDPEKLVKLLTDRTETLATRGTQDLAAASDSALKLGNVLFFSDRPKALDALRRATELNPKNAAAWMAYGTLNLELKDFTQAEIAFNEIFDSGKSDPKDPIRIDLRRFALSEAELANVYYAERMFEHAETALNTAILLFNPKRDAENLLTAYRVRADVYVALKKYPEAETELHNLEAIIRETDKNDEVTASEEWYKKLNFEIKVGRCALDGQQSKWESALASCKAVLDISGGLPHQELNIANANYFLGRAEMSTGNLEASELHLRAAKKFYDNEDLGSRSFVYGNLGILLTHTSNKAEGCSLLNQAIALARTLGSQELETQLMEQTKTCEENSAVTAKDHHP